MINKIAVKFEKTIEEKPHERLFIIGVVFINFNFRKKGEIY